MQQHIRPGGTMFRLAILQFIVRQPVAARHEDQGGRTNPRHVERVMPRPGPHTGHAEAEAGARGIRNLVFTGIATNVCVESSLRDAFHLEYFSVVLEDATHAAGPDFAQKAALYNIETFFGWVSTVADFSGAVSQTQAT